MANSINPLNNYTAGLTPQATLNGTIGTIVYASNYNDLDNKPSINSVELRGNKTASDLGLATPEDILVTSVNTQTGDVVLTGANIAYDNSYSVTDKINDLESQIVDSGVDSVNGMTGNVTLTATDINYSVGVSIKNKIDTVEQEIPIVNYPVTSVNTKTGAVVLGGNDIEYSSGVSVNSKIDAVEQSIPVVDYPVTSVNEQTGAVSLTGADIPLGSDFTDPTSTAYGVNEAKNYKAGDTITFNFQQLFCRIDSSGKRISVFIPLIKNIPSTLTVTASGNYSVYYYDGTSLLSNHDIANDTQSIQNTPIGIVLTITLTTAMSQTLGYGAVELRNTFTLTFS